MSEFLIGDDLATLSARVEAKRYAEYLDDNFRNLFAKTVNYARPSSWTMTALAERPVPERQDGPRPSSGNP